MRLGADAPLVHGRPLGYRAEHDLGPAEIFFVEAARWKDIGRVCEVGQRRQRHAMRHTDRRLQHAAHPAWDAVLPAEIVDGHCVGEATNAARLDVDVATGVYGNRLPRLFQRRDAFVEADRRANLLLKLGVVQQIIVGQWLLDHGQMEFIDGPEERRIREAVAAVAINVEYRVGKLPTHGAKHRQIPARPELQLHAAEAGGDGFGNLRQQFVYRIHHAKIRADDHIRALAAQDAIERLTERFGV